jgi:hypothetical protein
MKDDPRHTSNDNDSLLTLIDPIELMPEDVVEIIDYPEICFEKKISDTDSKPELLEFDF